MSAPSISFAYFNYDRDEITVVCYVDQQYLPLELAPLGSAANGWTVKKDGVTQSFSATVADRPNTILLAMDSASAGDFTIEYDSAFGNVQDNGNQALATKTATDVLGPQHIIDLIARDFKLRLPDINTDDPFGTFLFDLEVVDDLKDIQRIREGLTLISYDDPQVEDDAPINHEQFTAAFHIVIATAQSTAESTPLSSREFQLEAEVMKHLQVDYTRSGLAIDTIPAASRRVELGDGGWGGIEVNLTVRFRTLYGDRFSQ